MEDQALLILILLLGTFYFLCLTTSFQDIALCNSTLRHFVKIIKNQKLKRLNIQIFLREKIKFVRTFKNLKLKILQKNSNLKKYILQIYFTLRFRFASFAEDICKTPVLLVSVKFINLVRQTWICHRPCRFFLSYLIFDCF